MRWGLRLAALTLAAAAAECTVASEWLLRETIEIGGKEVWTGDVRVTREDILLVTVRERGANVALSISSALAGSSNLHVDSPIDRGGLLAVVLGPFTAAPDARFDVRISSHEPSGYRSTVEVAVQRLTAARGPPEHTVRAWLQFMKAGQQYASVNALRHTAQPGHAEPLKHLVQAAANDYAAAAASAREAGHVQLFAQATFHHAWITYQDLSEFSQSIAGAQAALEAMHGAGDEYGSSRALSLGASALRDSGNALLKSIAVTALPAEVSAQFMAAVDRFRSVERFHEVHQQRFEQAQAINNIGLTYYLQGEYQQALAHYERAIEIFRLISDRPNQARSIQNAALVHFELGQHRACSSAFAKALASLERTDDLQLYGDILNNAALCLYVQGQFDRALGYYEEAFRVQTQLQNELQIARTLHGMGSTYYSMGDRDTGLELYSQALARRTGAKDARGRAATLSAMGNIACSAGRSDEAVSFYSESLTLAVAPSTRGRIQLRLARCLIRSARLSEADSYLKEVERSVAPSDAVVRSLLMLELGRADAARGRWPQARARLEAATSLLGKYELVEEQSEALLLLASGASSSGSDADALRYAEQGIRLAEQIRGRSRNPELRATLFAPWRKFYDLKISLLLRRATPHGSAADVPAEAGRLALQAAEQARFRVLEEILREPDGTEGSASTQRHERERVLTELTEKRVQLARRQEWSGADDERTKHLLRDIAGLRARLNAVTTAMTPALVSEQRKDPFSALRLPVPDDTAIIAYWIGGEHAVAWVLTAEGLRTQPLVGAARISTAAAEAHGALASMDVPQPALTRALREASNLLLAPLPEIRQKKRWIILADGPLHYLPFAALPAPGSDLASIAEHEIAVAPALRLIAAPDRAARRIDSALLVADPVFDLTDDRLATAAPSAGETVVTSRINAGFPRLKGTAAEIDRIAAHLSGAKIKRLVGFDAGRDELLASLQSSFDLLHVATHSRIDADFPQLSAIALSRYDAEGRERNPWVHASELRSLYLRNSYVVLSACESALGKRIEGEGLVGLSYALLGAGARGVVASTWRIADAATVAYMDSFYGSMRERADISLAAARAARAMLSSKRWNHPRYWASFVVFKNEL